MRFSAPKGTQDLLPARAAGWLEFTRRADEVFSAYGYEPIATPTFEGTELFTRSVGETSDVATKEIFSVRSMGAMAAMREGAQLKRDQILALRPEGTAGVVRAIAQNNLVPQGAAPAKLWYAGPMFRAERPQKGRYREFRQVGVECLGATDSSADAEMIIMCMRFFEKLGIPADQMTLLINSMGDEACRPAYTQAVREYESEHIEELCEDCRRRIETNPLRSFDCKNDACKAVMSGAPRFPDYLCDECSTRYAQVKSYLSAAGISFLEDPRLVRGFDYYTGTVFEVQVSAGLGTQTAIGGGGHYDKLMGEISGKDLPGLGFAVGFERIMLVLEELGVELACKRRPFVYIALVDESLRERAFAIMQEMRDAGIAAQMDMQGRSLKSQFKVAGKTGAAFALVVGPDELADGVVTCRDMATHEETRLSLDAVVEEMAQRCS